MERNNKGFTLIELLAVIVVLAVIALIATPIILGIINDARESANARSVEDYAKAIETTVTTYLTLNPDVENVVICTDSGTTSGCQVDATSADTTVSGAEKKVTYSGSRVKCTDATFDRSTGVVKVTGCKVGSSDTAYSWETNAKEGAKKDA
jgi:type IV pilus assembly protein PilA